MDARPKKRITRRRALALTVGAGTGAVAGLAYAGSKRAGPGVYVQERDPPANKVVPVETAVPAFIGHTEKVTLNGESLNGKPLKISKLQDFYVWFGGAPTPKFEFVPAAAATGALTAQPTDPGPSNEFSVATSKGGAERYALVRASPAYMLEAAIRLFFDNGGRDCYVVSVGDYATPFSADAMIAALKALERETEPSMVVIPEAMRLTRDEAMRVEREMLIHCGETTRSRFALLDVFGGWRAREKGADPIQLFRDDIGARGLGYGAAYYPWLNTALRNEADYSWRNLTAKARNKLADLAAANIDTIAPELTAEEKKLGVSDRRKAILDVLERLRDFDPSQAPADEACGARSGCFGLSIVWPAHRALMRAMADAENLLPPAAAIAGIYARTDDSRGVWKAPANASVDDVVSLPVSMTDAQREALNVDAATGKSVNAIRSLPSRDTLVWGARTLDGNSSEWRYVNVRRTMIMIEQSARWGIRSYVFEPNEAVTWTSVKAMLTNFLSDLWKQGALMGATPQDAYGVSVGLGETMTAQDILDSKLKVSLRVALLRPAEFLVVNIEQRLQTAP